MALALSSLVAGPTEQKVFKRLNRQVELLSRRTRILLSFLECQTQRSKREAPRMIAHELIRISLNGDRKGLEKAMKLEVDGYQREKKERLEAKCTLTGK